MPIDNKPIKWYNDGIDYLASLLLMKHKRILFVTPYIDETFFHIKEAIKKADINANVKDPKRSIITALTKNHVTTELGTTVILRPYLEHNDYTGLAAHTSVVMTVGGRDLPADEWEKIRRALATSKGTIQVVTI